MATYRILLLAIKLRTKFAAACMWGFSNFDSVGTLHHHRQITLQSKAQDRFVSDFLARTRTTKVKGAIVVSRKTARDTMNELISRYHDLHLIQTTTSRTGDGFYPSI